MDLIKIKNCTKSLVKGMKRQATDWEKICAKDPQAEYANSHDSTRRNNPMKKLNKRFEHFNKENMQVAKHIKDAFNIIIH